MAGALTQKDLQTCAPHAMDRGALAMSEDNTSARDAAMALLTQYGDDASVIATLRAAEVAAMGDVDALAHWDAVISFLEEGPAPDQLS